MRGRNLARLAPFFLVSLGAGLWTIWEQKNHASAVGPEWAQTWLERILIAGKIPWFYLGKLIWPHPLTFIYPRWTIDPRQPLVWFPALAVLFVTAMLWRKRKGSLRPLFFVFAYFIVSLFPVSAFFNVYFFRYSFVSDHFQYLAAMGPLALITAWITPAVDSIERWKSFFEAPGLRRAIELLQRSDVATKQALCRSHDALDRHTLKESRGMDGTYEPRRGAG